MAALEHNQLNHNHNHNHNHSNNNNNIKEAGLRFLPRSCDACLAAAALLFCRSHSAFFCGACDCATAGLRHVRVWMCEVCEQAPAVVTCKADAAALCSACDADIHSANPLAHRHERVPVIPFVDSVSDFAARSSAAAFVDPPVAKEDDDAEAWLIQNPSSRVLMADFLCCDSDLPDFGFSSQNNLEKVTMNGSFENNNRSFTFGDSVVPTQSKGNLSFPTDVNCAFENCFDKDFSQPRKHHKLNSNEQLFSSFNNYYAQHSASSSETGVVPDGNANSMSEVSYTFTKSITTAGAGDFLDGSSSAGDGDPLTATDRKARVLRYREKRKNRKFEKTIRYASRKAYAETRPRIKGRFAKRTETNETSEIDQIYGFGSGSTGFLIDHGGYGVVPSF